AHLAQRHGRDAAGEGLGVVAAHRVEHGRLGGAGRDRVDAYALRAVVVRGGAGEADDRVLGRLVGAEARAALVAADARGVDDRSAAGLAHHAQLLAQAQPDALDVHLEEPVEVGFAHLVQRPALRDAGVVEGAAEPAEPLDGPAGRAGDRGSPGSAPRAR